MRLSDRLSGFIAGVLGLVVMLYARTFPPMPGQNVGPALFPTLIGAGLVAFGAWLIVADRRGSPVPLFAFDEWVRKPRMRGNAVLVVVALIFYILLVEPLGFLPTSVVFLSVLMAAFGATRRWILPTALVVSLVIHYSFYSLLRVPLPWGLLQGVAW